jgi:hypothetical protein
MQVVSNPIDFNAGSGEEFGEEKIRGKMGPLARSDSCGASLTGGGVRSARHPRLLLLVRFADKRRDFISASTRGSNCNLVSPAKAVSAD